MLFDNHVHTKFSADSQMSVQEAVDKAVSEGLGLVFTEHMDFDYPGELDFTFQPQEYWQEYAAWRSSSLRLGVEIGMIPGAEERNKIFLARVPFDLVIGSIHLVDGVDIYEKIFYQGHLQQDNYRRYFHTMAEMLRTNYFIDVLGHIDYIARYAPYEQPDIIYRDFQEEIDAVLRTAIDHNIILEINTRRLSSPLGRKTLFPIYQRYKQLGGNYITLGSDAHTADVIGRDFSLAGELATVCDLQMVTFWQRQIQLI